MSESIRVEKVQDGVLVHISDNLGNGARTIHVHTDEGIEALFKGLANYVPMGERLKGVGISPDALRALKWYSDEDTKPEDKMSPGEALTCDKNRERAVWTLAGYLLRDLGMSQGTPKDIVFLGLRRETLELAHEAMKTVSAELDRALRTKLVRDLQVQQVFDEYDIGQE